MDAGSENVTKMDYEYPQQPSSKESIGENIFDSEIDLTHQINLILNDKFEGSLDEALKVSDNIRF